MNLHMYIDGSAQPNPGRIGIGVVVVLEGGDAALTLSRTLGFGSNNEAEYLALIAGIEAVLERDLAVDQILSDSQLLVNQVNSVWKVRSDNLKPLRKRARELIKRAGSPALVWIPREANLADAASRGQ